MPRGSGVSEADSVASVVWVEVDPASDVEMSDYVASTSASSGAREDDASASSSVPQYVP